MAFRNGETRRGGNLDRASEMSLGGDISKDTALPLAIQARRFARRLGCSVEVAALTIELAGLGPREARR